MTEKNLFNVFSYISENIWPIYKIIFVSLTSAYG